jgi:DNA repair exonuclease SbcCD ATPase subunit
MTDPRPLLSAIARLTKERDDYRDLCRDFSGAESPETLVAALRDRQRMEAEIASLKAELAAAEEVARTAVQAIPVAMTAAAEKEREACAKIADAYAEENLRLADDTIRHDRFITGEERTPETFAKSEVLAIEGCTHSAMYHAALNIAAAVRARGEGGDHA